VEAMPTGSEEVEDIVVATPSFYTGRVETTHGYFYDADGVARRMTAEDKEQYEREQEKKRIEERKKGEKRRLERQQRKTTPREETPQQVAFQKRELAALNQITKDELDRMFNIYESNTEKFWDLPNHYLDTSLLYGPNLSSAEIARAITRLGGQFPSVGLFYVQNQNYLDVVTKKVLARLSQLSPALNLSLYFNLFREEPEGYSKVKKALQDSIQKFERGNQGIQDVKDSIAFTLYDREEAKEEIQKQFAEWRPSALKLLRSFYIHPIIWTKQEEIIQEFNRREKIPQNINQLAKMLVRLYPRNYNLMKLAEEAQRGYLFGEHPNSTKVGQKIIENGGEAFILRGDQWFRF